LINFTKIFLVKKEIIHQSALMFLEYGTKSVTMDDIAVRMHISKKTIYSHFEDKPSLVRAAVFQIFDQVKSQIFKIQDESENSIIAIYEIKKIAVQVLAKKDSSVQYQLQKYYPKIHDELRKMELDTLGASFEKSINKGIKKELFRASIDPQFITRIYFNGFAGIRNIKLFSPKDYKIDQLIDQYIDYHLRAIVTPKGLSFLESYNSNKNHEN
jgi:AcrR family transcriptional regulator